MTRIPPFIQFSLKIIGKQLYSQYFLHYHDYQMVNFLKEFIYEISVKTIR